MKTRDAAKKEPIPSERLAEAGVWIARLHGDERGRDLEDGFREWLRANAMNAQAFELSTDVWEDAQNLRRVIPFERSPPRPRRTRFSFAFAAAAAATIMVIIAATVYFLPGGVATGVGEQRMLTLEDGTRVYLNTETRVVVNYDKNVRQVELKAGEAFFDVAKRPNWPFIVTAGEQQVRALGTSFIVRRDDNQLAVTLVEGKITVSPSSSADSPDTPPEKLKDGPESSTAKRSKHPSGEVSATKAPKSEETFTLIPGQRLVFIPGKAAQLDTPPLDKTTAWRRGQVVLDDTPLSNAVAEMNRYNSVKLVIERPEARELLVNGLFQAGDSMSLANAVAQTYELHIIERDDEIVLSGIPRDR